MSAEILQAERSALGAAMADAVGADKVCDLLKPDDFLDKKHALIFATIAALAKARQACGPLEVAASIARHGLTFDDLADMAVDAYSNSGHATRNAQLVLEASQLRQAERLCAEVMQVAKDSPPLDGSVSNVLDMLREGIDAITSRLPTRMRVSLTGAEPDLVRRILEDEPTPRGFKSGFCDIDDILGGFRNGEMVVLAARPSVGKSLLACNIAENVALADDSRPVLIFSMEMSASSLYRRALFGRAGVDADMALAGLASKEDKDRIRTANAELKRAKIDIQADAAMTAQRVHSSARRFRAEHGECLIVIDYLQLMRGEGKGIYEQVTNLSKAMKAMAVDLDIPVLVLSQLSRNAAESREKDGVEVKKPLLSDLRDSGAIEQDADVVIMMARNIKQRDSHPVHIGIEKNRPAKTGDCEVLFDASGPRFRNIARVERFDGRSL